MKTTFYRAAKKGITKMNAGSYYTFSEEIASNYIDTDIDVLYSFDKELNLFDVTKEMDITDFDHGLRNIFEILEENDINVKDVFENYDGIMLDCSDKWDSEYFILFGSLEVSTNKLERTTFEEMLIEDELFEIVK